MSFTVFLGNLPAWVTADDIKGWLSAENLVADAIKVIRNPETQESKGFAFIDAPNTEEMNSIIRRFDRAPLEDRLLRANPAQPPKAKSLGRPVGAPSGPGGSRGGHEIAHNPARGPHTYAGSAHAGSVQAPAPHAAGESAEASVASNPPAHSATQAPADRPPRRGKKSVKRQSSDAPPSAFAEELAKVL
jgi:RNA recognition motif-containing protein